MLSYLCWWPSELTVYMFLTIFLIPYSKYLKNPDLHQNKHSRVCLHQRWSLSSCDQYQECFHCRLCQNTARVEISAKVHEVTSNLLKGSVSWQTQRSGKTEYAADILLMQVLCTPGGMKARSLDLGPAIGATKCSTKLEKERGGGTD